VPLTADALVGRKDHFWERTTHYRRLGYDRVAAPSFILDEGGALDGPALDVGTGMGLTARALAGRGLDVISIDTNADDQQVAAYLTDDPELLRRIRFSLVDAARMPFADGHFGCAVAVDVLHHLETGVPVLTEIVRVVKPGGLMVLADFSREGFDLVSRVHAAEGRVHPEGPVTVDWARGFMRALGMTELKTSVGHLHQVSVLRAPHARHVPQPAAQEKR
jgi:SAM-dependent methyltransferase